MFTVQKMGDGNVSGGNDEKKSWGIRLQELIRRENFNHQFSAVSGGLVVKHVEAYKIFTQDVNLMLRVDVVCYMLGNSQ